MRNQVCIFIDGSNFYSALKRNNYSTRVDYHEFSKALAGPDRELVRTYYYNSAYDPVLATDKVKTQQFFFDSLRKTPRLEVRLGRIVSGPDVSQWTRGEKTLFSSDLVYFAAIGFFDTAIVITEDNDFCPVLSCVKELDRAIEIGFFNDCQPKKLIQASDRIIPLSEVLEKLSSKIFLPISEGNIGNQIIDNNAPMAQARANVAKTNKSSYNLNTKSKSRPR